MNDINFFKPYLGKSKEKINFNIYIYGTMAVVGFLIVVTLIINTVRIFILNKNINEYNKKLNDSQIQSELKEAESLNKQITILNEYNSALGDIATSVKQRDNVSDTLLNSISSTVPSEVSFKKLDIVENTINIKGVSTNRIAVAELKHNLSELPVMKDVYVNSIDNSSSVENEYSFDIKCVLKDVE